MDLFLTGIFASCAVGALKMQLPEKFKMLNVWRIVGGMILIYLSFWSLATSAVGYNDAGYCTHIRTFRGAEGAKCDLGWYFSGWGEVTRYPHFVTVSNTSDKKATGDFVEKPYDTRLADNWAGRISQTTRFKLPHDRHQFVELARDFGSPERLVTALLRPAVNVSMDTVASMYSMEEYYKGGKRDKFKKEFRNTVSKGQMVQIDKTDKKSDAYLESLLTTSNDPDSQRIPHSFQAYGIEVEDAIMHTMKPETAFVNLIGDRKHAENKRILAKEKRMAEEEQHLLAVARQEIEIAKQTTEALIDQARRTVGAETEKIIGIIAAKGELEEAQIDLETMAHLLKKAEVQAEIDKVNAQVSAFERKAMLSAEGRLDKKLRAYVETNQAWAKAYADRNAPQTVIAGNDLAAAMGDDAQTMIDSLSMKVIKAFEAEGSTNPASDQ